MNKLFILPIVIFTALSSCNSQPKKEYPVGITFDKNIESVCKKNKTLNQFKVTTFINDSLLLPENTSLSSLMGAGIGPIFSAEKQDTSLTFLNSITTSGIQLHFDNDSIYAQQFVSSKSCLCYKSDLLDKENSYGAGYSPKNQTIVLSQKPKFVKGEKIYGYIKTEGGNLFRINDSTYDKLRYDYEGYFEVKFESFFGNSN